MKKDDSSKVFDIAKPKKTVLNSQPTDVDIEPEDKPAITPTSPKDTEDVLQKEVSADQKDVDTLIESEEPKEKSKNVSRVGVTVMPASKDFEAPSIDSQETKTDDDSSPIVTQSPNGVATISEMPKKEIAEEEVEPEPESEPGPEESAKSEEPEDQKPTEEAVKDAPSEGEKVKSATSNSAPTSYSAVDAMPEDARTPEGQKLAEEKTEATALPESEDTKEFQVPIGKAHHGSSKGAFALGIICAVIVVAAAVYIMYYLNK